MVLNYCVVNSQLIKIMQIKKSQLQLPLSSDPHQHNKRHKISKGIRNPLLVNLGLRIKMKRIECSMNQTLLSELSGIDRTYLSDVENGRRNISILVIKRISSNLGLSLDELFMGL